LACLDGAFLSSALVKVPTGAWFTLLLSALLACLFILWRFGKEQQWFAEANDRFPTTHFVKTCDDGRLQLTDTFGGNTLSAIQGFGIFFDKAGETTPIVFNHFIRKLVTAPEVIVFFHLRPLEVPSVAPEERYSVTRLAIPNCYRLVVRHGYMDEIITLNLASLIYEKVHEHIIVRALDREGEGVTRSMSVANGMGRLTNLSKVSEKTAVADASEATATSSSDIEQRRDSTPDSSSSTSARLTALERAYNHEVLYIIGKEQMNVKPGTNIVRRVLLELFLFLRDNTRTKIASLKVPQDKIIEVGFIKDV
jgi:KUP system potassium uptake protein